MNIGGGFVTLNDGSIAWFKTSYLIATGVSVRSVKYFDFLPVALVSFVIDLIAFFSFYFR